MTGNVQLYLPGPCIMDWMGAPLVGFVRPVKRRLHPRLACRIDAVDTVGYGEHMTKPLPSTGPGAAIPPASGGTRGSINLRIEGRTRQLIDDAAAVLGKTRTEFMIESARRQAIDVLLDQRLFQLEPAHHEAFLDALDNPPAPGPKLRALLRRAPAWRD